MAWVRHQPHGRACSLRLPRPHACVHTIALAWAGATLVLSRVTLNTLLPNCTACFRMRVSLVHTFWWAGRLGAIMCVHTQEHTLLKFPAWSCSTVLILIRDQHSGR